VPAQAGSTTASTRNHGQRHSRSITGPRRDPSLALDDLRPCPSRRLRHTPPPRPAAYHRHAPGRSVPSSSTA
jgi:hypothetical protein